MILVVYKEADELNVGVKVDEGIVFVSDSVDDIIQNGMDMLPEIQAHVDMMKVHPDAVLNESEVMFAPCVPNPGKIICVGLNYRRHAEEGGFGIPATPVLFSKFNNAVAAHGDDVPFLDVFEQVDYEAELGVVIGKRGKNIAEADALDYVLGYCNMNDLSERALQMLTGQWLLGKTLDGFLPMGPYLVTKDEVPDPQNLSIKCWLNGELCQDSNTSDMIFSVAEIIAYASRHMTLEPGDVISTGTPEGVILGMDPKVWMKAGDKVVVEVGSGKLGQLHNTMVAE